LKYSGYKLDGEGSPVRGGRRNAWTACRVGSGASENSVPSRPDSLGIKIRGTTSKMRAFCASWGRTKANIKQHDMRYVPAGILQGD